MAKEKDKDELEKLTNDGLAHLENANQEKTKLKTEIEKLKSDSSIVSTVSSSTTTISSSSTAAAARK